jgi:site-specific DNA-methyltransferase (adenine-specific)
MTLMGNALFHSDNLSCLRESVSTSTVDLCYLDPPFYSQRKHGKSGGFTDIWSWSGQAERDLSEATDGAGGRLPQQSSCLLQGLVPVIGKVGLLAYLAHLALRLGEIHRVLKPSGSLYLHCDPTASHYVKVLLDSIFIPAGGAFRNEIVWQYKTGGTSRRWFSRKHDTILFYTKSDDYTFNPLKERSFLSHKYGFANIKVLEGNCPNVHADGKEHPAYYTEVAMRDVWDIPALRGNQPETNGYPTQKPIALLKRIIEASSNPGDLVLDPYCGSGTTLRVAEDLRREWIGIDESEDAISATRTRLQGLEPS